MRSENTRIKLLQEFPELGAKGILPVKEIFAHFGLTFLEISKIEYSIIHICVWWKEICADGSKYSFGEEMDKRKRRVLGSLVKEVCEIGEFSDLRGRLEEMGRIRNHFAHHFMRENASLLAYEEGCSLILEKIAEVRWELEALEAELDSRFKKFMTSASRYPSEQVLEAYREKLLFEARVDLANGTAKAGWEL